MSDAEDLAKMFALVRERVPQAVSIDLETSDQDTTYGFNLRDVTLADGSKFSEVDERGFESIVDDAWEHLRNIDWDGVVGEDAHGYATLAIPSL